MGEPLLLDARQTAAKLPFPELVAALQRGFAKGCQTPARHHHTLRSEGEPDGTLLLMPAWSNADDEDHFLGVKLVTIMPGNMNRRLPAVVSTYMLYDAITGEQLALMDGNTLTSRRTVATSALGAKYLSREDASSLVIIGAGRVGSLIADAYSAVRRLRRIVIWDINPEQADRLASSLRDQGLPAKSTTDIKTAIESADIVSAATLATAPIIRGEWLKPGTHVDLIGAFTPEMREADDEVMRRSSIYVDTAVALEEAGELIKPLAEGVIGKNAILGTLTDLCRKDEFARANADQITCFKSVGSGLADLTAAQLVYRRI
ncbi:ornithine cyclodeaminase family protein [Ensifer sp. ENS10]|uniref:ornithine cyclodeaminase family protein n=1 Tax=unclassified Ensifer TaxID=2633371 RepID=UPI00070ADCB3|nr:MULTISPECIES: ornithine cyclodeaminase family protein [unclassified Ensifer]KRD72572.1 ornithine cyclodeaminase [Ensifer sp. Root278]MBD9508852.1 ornithine cyclodeaminase family protein [Ensifer sp. ENS10]